MATSAEQVEEQSTARRYKVQYPISAYTFPREALIHEVRFDDVVVNFRRCEALKGGQPVELTRKELGVLRLLAARAGDVVKRDDLLTQVWGYDSYSGTRTVDNHIASLRAKLEAEPADPRRLITVHGIGYKLTIS